MLQHNVSVTTIPNVNFDGKYSGVGMASGIYVIVNKTNGKQYVGSAMDLVRRKSAHFSKLRCGTHSSKHMQAAFRKYGESAFEFSVLECVDNPIREMLLSREQHWIDKLRPEYNKRLIADSNQGLPVSPEMRAFYSEQMAAHCATPEGKAHITRLSLIAKAQWADPILREKRLAKMRAAWTQEKRSEVSAFNKLRAQHLLIDGTHFGTRRIWTEEEKARQSASLSKAWDKRAPVVEQDIHDLATTANAAWKVVGLTGLRNQDKATVFCEVHQCEHTVTIAKLKYEQRGCKLCGYARSSEVQKGRSKKQFFKV